MNAEEVVFIYQLLEQNQIEICIDGGWGVDALLGEQSRPHLDLDIALEHRHVPQLRQLLEARGYHDIQRDDTRDCNFVMGDPEGRLIDIHTYVFNGEGSCIFGVEYPLESLNGTGILNGCPVRCITPAWMVKFHTGYILDENDYHDVSLLCQRFGMALPVEYEDFIGERK